jgi:ketosteroid isomerase-like protein
MSDTLDVVNHLAAAVNAHDLDALAGCFAPDYVNHAPAHPLRGFCGRDQVRRNWAAIFAGLPDIAAQVTAAAADGEQVFTEWEMSGTRRDGTPHAMAGVIIFGIRDGQIVSARFYLEPVESVSGDVNAAVAQFTTGPTS